MDEIAVDACELDGVLFFGQLQDESFIPQGVLAAALVHLGIKLTLVVGDSDEWVHLAENLRVVD